MYRNYVNDFSRKKLSRAIGPFWAQRMTCCHNSGSTLKTFLKFCAMKRVKRYMKIISMVFLKKVFSGQMGHSRLKNDTVDIDLDPL